MFGTLQLNPSDAGPIFVERADGAVFSALGNNVPQHTACDQCRQKKLRCTGRKTGCDRCKANSTDCTYTQLFAGNGRRRERKRTASQNDSSGASAPSPEQPGSDTAQSTVVVSTRSSPSLSRPANDSAPVTSGDDNDTSSSDPLGQDISRPLDAWLLENSYDEPNVSSNGSGVEFSFFDLDTTTLAPRTGFDLTDSNSNLPGFHWSPFALPSISSPRGDSNTQPDTHSLLEEVSNLSRASTAMTATRVLGHAMNGGSNCTSQCLKVMKSLLEELEARMHDMAPGKADVALSYQKKACIQCSQVVVCKSCYVDPDAMMFLIMICDKLIMLNKKILWYTMEGSSVEQSLFAGEYEMDQLDEWGGMVQHLSAVQLRKIKLLVDDIETSPAIEGKHAQLIMLRSVKQQAIKLLGRIREALSKVVVET